MECRRCATSLERPGDYCLQCETHNTDAVVLDLARESFDLPGEFHSTGTRRVILLRTGVTVDHDPLTFSFALPKGSYATVVLREFLKSHPSDLT